jgi:hypothetical protein
MFVAARTRAQAFGVEEPGSRLGGDGVRYTMSRMAREGRGEKGNVKYR